MRVRAALMVGGIATVVVTMANPAMANNFSASTTGSTASYTDSGNVLSVRDTSADGYSAVGQLRRPNGTIETLTNSNGSGTTKVQSFSIAEDRSIAVRACRRSGSGSIVGCSGWVNGYS